MGAETTIHVRVLKTHEEWVEVQAVTMEEAGDAAMRLPGVCRVLEIAYELPHD